MGEKSGKSKANDEMGRYQALCLRVRCETADATTKGGLRPDIIIFSIFIHTGFLKLSSSR
jgi:hypothetical protein